MNLDPRLLPHQRDGVRALVEHPAFALFDEPGAGKTFQVIAAAEELYRRGTIDTAVVICPASVRIQWRSPDFGEIEKWSTGPRAIHEYHAKHDRIIWQPNCLNWVITNYEFVRAEPRWKALANQLAKRRTLIAADESSRIKSHKADQTKACTKLRKVCDRATVLNGTPVANSPMDLFAQMAFLDPAIIGLPNWWTFRARYAVMGGFKQKQIVAFRNIDELNDRIRPFILQRLKQGLPEKRYTTREVALTATTWRHYKEMRDGLVTWLDEQPSMAPQAIVKILRLAQLTSGFLGGLQPPDAIDGMPADPQPPREIGREKLGAFVEWLEDTLARGRTHMIVWGRFRAELDRAQQVVEKMGITCVKVRGGQGKVAREEAIKTFHRENLSGPIVLFGSPHAGGLGLTLVEAHDVFYMSNDFSLIGREQSEDRCHRHGQTCDVDYVDLVATGPDGQKTIDHVVVKALRKKRDIAAMTTADWRRELTEEA